jgi:hypothetical protein
MQTSHALLEVVDRLAAEFPHVPHVVVYETVGEVRPIAARRLPDVIAYRDSLEREGRLVLARYHVGRAVELGPGTAGPAHVP